MSYLLDTCVLSELRKNIPQNVGKWFENIDSELFFLSVVTLAELWDGIERLPASKKRKDLEDWFFGEIHTRFKNHIIPIDDQIAKTWGSCSASLTKRGLCVGVQDLYIASTAIARGFALVTVNVKDFEMFDLTVINPWSK